MTSALPSHARAVIVGGGVIGCSTAYHLARQGWQDVVLIERKQVSSGTTWHAAGLITTLRDTEAQTKLATYSLKLYQDLEAETGQSTGFVNCGSVQLAMTPEKAEEMRRGCAMARTFGVENREITPAEVRDLFPLAYVDDLVAGFHFPNDGRVNPADVAQALAKGARQRGVKIVEHCAMTGLITENGRAVGVHTEHGDIRAEVVVLCPGMWGRELGLMTGLNLPLQAAEHYYLISEPIEGLHNKLPILRDPGRAAYAREEAGKILLGFFEPVAAPWAVDGISKDFCFDEIQPDWERMEPYIERAMQRLPILFETGIRQFFCGPESFTPDHNYLMGRAPYLDRLFVACGFNSLGILSGGGAGHVMARWIEDGIQPMDIWDVDVRRIQPSHNNKSFVVARTVESLGIGYQMHWPNRQWETARNVKQSVLHDRVKAAGACFGESAGWERPNWYARPGQKPEYEYSFGRQNWFANNAAEHRAVREAVGVFEQSSFSKLLVQGRDAERVLNRIATADMAMPVGRLVYCHFLNKAGGVEADLTISRLAEDRYLVVTPAFTTTQVRAWLHENTPADACCVVTEVTGAWAMLNVQGPNSRALLSAMSSAKFDNESFPFGTWREIEIGFQHALALRVSYTGELGFELYIPTEMALPVYDRLVEAGRDFGLAHCGYHTLNTLRAEKAYREWAHDMGPLDSLLEAGLGFTCAWDKPGGFIGREALLAQREAGPLKRRLVQFLLDDPEPVLVHAEPILRDGQRVGYTTSAGYGHTLGASVALGYVHCEGGVTADYIAAGRYTIEQADRTYTARASLTPMYDPKNLRCRG
ncbi:MAG: FAD-dependent oxidoreductase [Gammaproteobacteria bacterium]|nr:FAD-dependent oxidoreductase [Gammaproteobacteria bacterium]